MQSMMQATQKMDGHSRVTIPSSLRKIMNIDKNDFITFVVTDVIKNEDKDDGN